MDHSYAGDITVKLAHPDGTEITLMHQKGGSANYEKENLIFYRKHVGDSTLDTNYGSVSSQTIKVADFAAFEGKKSEGRWMLTIRDSFTADQGMVDSVELKLCESVSVSGDKSNTTSTSTEAVPSLIDDGLFASSSSGFFQSAGSDSSFSPDTPVDPIPSYVEGSEASGSSTTSGLSTSSSSNGETGLTFLPPGASDDSDSGALAPVADITASGAESGADLPPPVAQDSDDSSGLETTGAIQPDQDATSGGAERNGSRGGGGGDPHFKTWTGIKYDYHGECDLVLVDNPSFADGKGLRLHIRTVRKGYYSYIERAALQIGADSMEFINRNDWTINGEKPSNGEKVSLGGFRVFRFPGALSVRLNEAEKIKIDFLDRKNGMPYIVVDDQSSKMFEGSLGMIGDWTSGTMMGRDGVTLLEDPETFALEWQVRDTEPMLFSTIRAPQFPAKCIPPAKMMGNRLGSSSMRKMAEKACASWKEDKEDCIFDVMATRDLGAAEAPGAVIG